MEMDAQRNSAPDMGDMSPDMDMEMDAEEEMEEEP